MQIFFTIIGIAACVSALMFAVTKAIETVFFFKGFYDKVTKSLARIEETLLNHKP